MLNRDKMLVHNICRLVLLIFTVTIGNIKNLPLNFVLNDSSLPITDNATPTTTNTTTAIDDNIDINTNDITKSMFRNRLLT